MKTVLLALTICPILLVACGSTTSSPPASLTKAKNLNATYSSTAATPAASMPSAGTASYTGSAVFGDNVSMSALLDAPDMSADAVMTADFSSGTVNGSVTNFHKNDGSAVSGALTLNGVAIAGNAIAGGINGTIGSNAVAADLTGQFLGAGHEAISGAISGTVGADALNGAFIVAK